MLTFRDGISIAELIVYIPSLVAAVWLTVRRGFGRSIGWFFIIIFTLIRISGAACQLAEISSHSLGGVKAVFICNAVGLSPLLLVLVGLLFRV